MATYRSVQRTKQMASPPKMLAPNELKGRARVAWFEYTVPVGNLAINDIVELCELPNGSRILGGEIAWEAMTTGAAAATGEIGTAASSNRYLEATSMDAIGNTLFANTIARNMGDVMTADTVIQLKVTVEAWAAGKKIAGWFRYALD